MSEPIEPSRDKFEPPEIECPEGCTGPEEGCLDDLNEFYAESIGSYSDTLVEAVEDASADYVAALAACGSDVACIDAAASALIQATNLAQQTFDNSKATLDTAYTNQAIEQCCDCGDDEEEG